MPRINVWLTPSTIDHLNYYVRKTYKGHKATSLTVEQAIKEFLCSHLKCVQCQRSFEPYNNSDTWVLHHKIPLAEGGTDEPENRMVLCRPCHNKIHDTAGGARRAKNKSNK